MSTTNDKSIISLSNEEVRSNIQLKQETNKSIYIILFIIVGTLHGIFQKLQSKSFTKILDAPFNHPWLQCFLMFVGELFCLIIWIVKGKELKREQEEERISKGIMLKPNLTSKLIIIIPTLCDIISSTLLNISLFKLSASIFQMLRGGVIIFTCIFTIIFLKKKIEKHKYIGIFICIIGLILVGLASKDDKENSPVCICLILISLIFTAFQYVAEEKILDSYNIHPIQLVSWESIFGILFFIILLPIIEFIPCNKNISGIEHICSENMNGDYYLENLSFAFKQIMKEYSIMIFCIGSTICIGILNYLGVMISKLYSSATRSIMGSTRTIFIWIFFMGIEINSTREPFILLQLIGFIFVIIGQLAFNKIIKFEFLIITSLTNKIKKSWFLFDYQKNNKREVIDNSIF